MDNFFKRVLSSIVILPLIIYLIIEGSIILLIFLLFCFFVASYEWYMMTKTNSKNIYGFILLAISFFSFYKLSIEPNEVFFVILICVSTDIGGYLFGKIIKGPKLTKISPNKTYAGMIGGFLLSLFCLTIFKKYIGYSTLTFKIYLIAFLISAVSQIGDIIISYFKRKSKIKNTGKIIPGHGGILDRIDGMIFSFPFFYLFKVTSFLNL